MNTPLTSHHDMMPIAESYQKTMTIFVHHVVKIIGVALVPNIFTLLLLLALQRSFAALVIALAARDPFLPIVISPLVLMVFLLLVIIIVQVLGNIALTYIVVHHERSGIMAAYEHAITFFWRFVKLGLAIFFVTILGYLVGILMMLVVGIILGKFNIELVTDAFTWLSILPVALAALFGTFFVFAGYSIIDRNVSVVEGLTQSVAMVRGHFSPVVVRVGLLYAVVGVVILALRLVPLLGDLLTLIVLAPFSILYLATLYHNVSQLNGS